MEKDWEYPTKIDMSLSKDFLVELLLSQNNMLYQKMVNSEKVKQEAINLLEKFERSFNRNGKINPVAIELDYMPEIKRVIKLSEDAKNIGEELNFEQ